MKFSNNPLKNSLVPNLKTIIIFLYKIINNFFFFFKVAIGKDNAQKKCGTLQPGEWKVKNLFGRDIVVTFKSDSHSNKKGFQAVYTFVPLEACE